MKKSFHQLKRPPIANSDNDDEDSKEMVIIKEMKSVYGKLIDELVRKVITILLRVNDSGVLSIHP